jgi:hypothetical protein
MPENKHESDSPSTEASAQLMQSPGKLLDLEMLVLFLHAHERTSWSVAPYSSNQASG